MDIIDFWVNLPYQAYSWQTVQSITDQNPVLVPFLLLVGVYGIAMVFFVLQNLMASKEGSSTQPFWYTCYTFGVDSVFVMLAPLYFGEIHYWLWELYCVFNVFFVICELVALKNFVAQRDALWGKYYDGPVPVRDAWLRGIGGFAIGLIGCIALRIVLGDTMGFILFMSTIVLSFGFSSWSMEQDGTRQGRSWAILIVGFLTALWTFLPEGLGFYATAIPFFRDNVGVYLLGAIALYGCIRSFYVYKKLPPKENAKELPWYQR